MFSHSVSTKDIVQTLQLWVNLAVSYCLYFQILIHFLIYLCLQRQRSNQKNWGCIYVQLEPMSWKTEYFVIWASRFDHQRKVVHSQSLFWVMKAFYWESKTFLKHMGVGGERGCCIILGMMATLVSGSPFSRSKSSCLVSSRQLIVLHNTQKLRSIHGGWSFPGQYTHHCFHSVQSNTSSMPGL